MSNLKKILNRIFIDGLSGMALGLFSTLIVGTILQQIAKLIGGTVGDTLFFISKIATILTGAGIGCGVAYKFKESPLVLLSAATAGMVGAYATNILNGTLLVPDAAIPTVSFATPGEPLGAFVAAYIAITIGHLVSGKTKIDILVTPIASIASGSVAGLLVGPSISNFITALGELINWGTERQPILMGIIVSVIMGMVLTLPISSAALGISLKLSGIAAGAACIGCCCNMIGFAVASYRENKVGGLFAQGVGTSMLQVPNIVKRPVIWLPAILSSAILGPISAMIGMTNNPTGSGMGTSGLVGQFMAFDTMAPEFGTIATLGLILVMHFILPAVISLLVSEVMRKKNLIRPDDMKLDA